MAGVACNSSGILQSAIDAGVYDVIVVGKDRAGNLYIAGAPPDVDRAVGMLMRAVATLSDCRIIHDVVIDTSDG